MAPGGGACSEARDGACVMHKEEDKTDKTSTGVIRAGAEGNTCEEATSDSNEETGKCKSTKCDVTIGGNPYCSQCSKDTEFPINGVCTTTIDGNTGCSAGGVCTQCKDGYFLHKGGCYKKGEEPGSLICKDATGTAGKCQACADGYFKNSDIAATTDSCIGCDDENCATCTEAGNNKCSKCKTTGTKTYLKAESGSTGTCVEASGCGSEFFPKADNSAGNKCISCNDNSNGVIGCEKCAAPAQGKAKPTCTKCTGKYLKTAPDGTTTCVEKDACKDDYFTVDDSTNGHKCVSCGDKTGVTDANSAQWKGVANCAKCTQPSAAGTATCEECASGYTLDSQANTCASSSTNRSGLSTGAIAGISVAAVVVVGGLVGFLCWWFVCRGKA